MLFGHGDDFHFAPKQVKHNFSSNVYFGGMPTALKDSIASYLDVIEHYPSPIGQELNQAAAAYHALSAEQFLFTNGATEAIYLIAQLFSGKTASIVSPTFSEYEDACRLHGIDVTRVLRENLGLVNTDLVFICNPNNPDGYCYHRTELIKVVAENSSTTFVIDEAYIDFAMGTDSLVNTTNQYQNLIILRSLTKTFAIPGLRLGYIVSGGETIEKLLVFKMPWSVNALAIHAGEFIFQNYESLCFDLADLQQRTKEFSSQLGSIFWLRVIPTQTSFILVELKQGAAGDLKQFLLRRHGILIRDANNFRGIELLNSNGSVSGAQYIRLATQKRAVNRLLINALNEWSP
jgi:threonine-phosphate decarboxylase